MQMKTPTILYVVKDSGSLNVISANLPNKLILAQDNEILTIGEQVEDKQFSHKKQEWRKQHLYNATLNPSLPPEAAVRSAG